jgi:hypothetical protein
MTHILRRNRIHGQFAPRLIEMLESPAYRALSLSAHRILARLEIELAHHGGQDNGKLPLTYDDIEHYGVDRKAIPPALRELQMLGFIEITELGRAGNGEFRRPHQYRLTYRNLSRANPTDEWRKIETAEQASEIVRTVRAKTKHQGWKNPNTRGGKPTTNSQTPGVETTPTAIVGKPPLLSISGVHPHSLPSSHPRSNLDITPSTPGDNERPYTRHRTPCEYCGKLFQHERPTARYCSAAHRRAAYRAAAASRPSPSQRGNPRDLDARLRVLGLLNDGTSRTVKEIMDRAGVRTRSAVDGLLYRLVNDEGLIERPDRGTYRLRRANGHVS